LLKLTNRRPVARHRGHYGMVTQLRGWLPDAIGGVYWVYLDNPKFSPYVPIYAGVQDTADCYKIYDPEAYSDLSARWTIDFVENLANLNYQNALVDVEEVRDAFEEKLFTEQAEIEKEALRLYEQSPAAAREYLTTFSQKAMTEVPKMFIKLREKLITKYTNNRE
jgi:dipeptidase